MDTIAGKTVTVLGYGNQGQAQALNLQDSGVNVVIGTPSGVRNAMNKYLKPGDRIDASIISIRPLTTQMVAERR